MGVDSTLSNCLFYAVKQLYSNKGGYLIIRKSHYGWWPHFLYSKDLEEFEEYTPIKPNHHLWFPPPLFKGYVRKYKKDLSR